ncbi:MAG: transaldolase [Candidatus Zambryskibacteria bacterium]|nr:transaldolase [Candidatus Zambryskibacteria bacterium]
MSKPQYLSAKIFLDSGDPAETYAALSMLGFLDGQTTNPSLVAKNPEIIELSNHHQLKLEILWEKYKDITREIHSLIPSGSVSVEVYADRSTNYENMLAQGKGLNSWFPGVFIKLPATLTGLQAARTLVSQGMNVNITLCFSQEQAAAVHSATKGAKLGQVYVSPFIGRLDDIGLEGLDLIKNIKSMYQEWGSHVEILGASIRNLNHFFGCLENGADIVTCPFKVLEEWNAFGLNRDPKEFNGGTVSLKRIDRQQIEERELEDYELHHELTEKGLEKFSKDWKSLISS